MARHTAMMTPEEAFQSARPRLWGLAYRMLGSAADAEDAVQDTYLRWQAADRSAIDKPDAWLTTACTRRCIDLLRAAHRVRVDYVGPWLPEPIVAAVGNEPADEATDAIELADSLSTAFLLLLERLTAPERAAFLLHDVFDYDYREVAAALDKSEEACRKLVSRARKRVGTSEARFRPEPERQRRLLESFLEALRSGAPERLEKALAEDIEFWADSGGKVIAARRVLCGARTVARFLDGVWRASWHRYDFLAAEVNGGPGLVLREAGDTVGVLSIAMGDDGRIAGIFVVRNPDKLGPPVVSST